MISLQFHDVVGVYSTKAQRYVSKLPNGKDNPFWSREIVFVMKDGTRQSVNIYGKSESDIADREYDASKVYAKVDECIGDMDIPPCPE